MIFTFFLVIESLKPKKWHYSFNGMAFKGQGIEEKVSQSLKISGFLVQDLFGLQDMGLKAETF